MFIYLSVSALLVCARIFLLFLSLFFNSFFLASLKKSVTLREVMGSGKGKARRVRGYDHIGGSPGGNSHPDHAAWDKILRGGSKGVIVPDDLIPCEVELIGLDGNTGALMGTLALALEKVGNSREVIDRFRMDIMDGDYNHALRVCTAYSYGGAKTDSEQQGEQQEIRDSMSTPVTF